MITDAAFARLITWAALLALLVSLLAFSQALSPGGFVDFTADAQLNFKHLASHTPQKYLLETMGSGVALLDYDNDGRLDIFFVNGAPLQPGVPAGFVPQKTGPESWNRLFHQKQNGTFEDVTEQAGLSGHGYGMGVAVGDFDNDGFEDVYVTSYGGNRLYRNNGDGTFTDITESAGVAGSGFSSSAAWVDLDNDGRLDLIVLGYVQWSFNDVWCGEHKPGFRAYCHPDLFNPAEPLVFHNDGNAHFTEVSHKIGLAKAGKGLGIAIADYDRDGNIDVLVANDSWPQYLYHGLGGGRFEEVGLSAGIAFNSDGGTYAGMGTDFADYNNDGLPDVAIDDLALQRYALYQNHANGLFDDVSDSSGISRMTQQHSGWGLRFFDFDNDGWKDLLVVQGHDMDTIQLTSSNLRYREPMLLARNTGKGFVDVSAGAGAVFQQPWVARGLAIGDFDNDGRVDAVVTTNDGPAHLLKNTTHNANHWLSLELIGHRSNRDAIGACVEVVTSAGLQYQTVTTSSSYLSSSDKRLHFGLGGDKSASRIDIRWPSGVRQSLLSVAGDRFVRVDEPSTGK